ncbi:hypothetical protein M413DRAFT_442463 [Hebeloma cylindrosporum]|uniref:Protein Zds1 C-terminal domain-containing protein n=1 Tax=Hebeloma cylindrosporum TaxID=76867 RepID=A0A0C3C6I1_HEBCY|nr:hypothetical protein M413DRAFT_442463 [Hebeloma cylindrosporum h7]
MAARPLQPSEYEIQREVEALRDLRRRSTAPGALTIDPDLPNQSSASSPTSLWPNKSPTHAFPTIDVGSASGPGEASSSSDLGFSVGSSRTTDNPNNPSDDPLHLFWVPASLHPEIAPAEFRAFLKEHARSPPSDGSEPAAGSTVRSLSSSSSLSRKRSMLSRQYRPKENDGVEDENVVPLKRNRSLLYPTNPGPQLTISDLQKLEELAEEASESDDPTRLRNVLRRSLSLNLSPSALDLMDEMPDMGDEADAPIIVPPPGQILRRAARTKIRKPGLPGDGGGHRFGASRRGAGAKSASTAPAEPRTSSEMSSSDHGEADSSPSTLRRPFSDEGAQNLPRPDSYSEETSIYDAYARDDDEDTSYPPVVVSPSQESQPLPISDEPPQIPIEVISMVPEKPVAHVPPQPAPVLHQPQPQHLSVPMSAKDQGPPARTPSPQGPIVERPTLVHSPPSIISTTPSPPAHSRKEKDKKSLFGKWGGDKGGKRGSKEKERENRERAEKEKESGFFGSLFGKKKQESEYQSSITGGTSGREAAQALLGASKSSKSYVPPTSPGLAPGIGGNPYARYPIHVERAIYRLSHIKLANPRRPLYEQVLISNLMFWYLGVINKAQNPSTTAQATTNGTTNSVGTTGESQDSDEQEQREKEQREKEEREKEQREKAEKERLEKEQREREREIELKKKESGRRGSLTKTPVGGPPGGRRAEMPIKGPQYEMQHRVMEQEYGGYNGQPPRSPTSPPANGPPGQLYPRAPQPGPYSNTPPKLVLPQQKMPAEQYYYQSQNENPHHRPALPPGAMPPADQSAWNNQTPSSLSTQQRPNPGPPRRSRSPPSQQHNHHPPQKQPMQLHKLTSQENLAERTGHRGPSRSMSATTYTSPNLPSPNGALRKGNSASAVSPYDKRPHTSEGRPGGNGEEEDVPLAVWQQQRRK